MLRFIHFTNFRHWIVIVLVVVWSPGYSEVYAKTASIPLLLAADETQEETLPTAVVWYLELAEKGDKDAQYNLASIYETGFGVSVDMKKAVHWFEKAALQGHEVSQLKLGMLYYVGSGAEQSIIKGNKWIQESAKSGNTLALLLKNEVIAHDVEKDIKPEQLIGRTLAAFEKGQINAEETLRLELQKIERMRRNEQEKARFAGTVTGSAAKPGTVKDDVPDFLQENPQALGPPEDPLVAVRRRALDGEPQAEYELGRRYEKGDGVEENADEAFKWYSVAAAKGNADAQYRLGLAYLYGIGAQQNIAQAGVWLNKAKEKMHPVATLLLNVISSTRNNVIDRPHSILLTWYLERSVGGDGEAMLGLGNMFEKGWGVQQDIEVAKRWYLKARSAGTKGASNRLRQIKAEAAAEQSDSSTQDITDMQATPASQLPGRTAAQLRESREVAAPDSGAEDTGFASIINKVKEYATPVGLLFLGFFMGAVVFRWMRGSQRNSVF